MRLRECRHDLVHVLHVNGDIDLHHASSLRTFFTKKAKRECPALILDLSAVRFIDSVGISVLIEYLRDATSFGGQFCVAGLTDHLRNVFNIVRLDRALPVFPSVEEAKLALCSGKVPPPPEPLFGERTAGERADLSLQL